MSTELSNRFQWMSLMCSCLVVIIHATSQLGLHVGSFYQFISEGICRSAVPFFFFTSGYFLFHEKANPMAWKDVVVKRLRTLGVPLVCWCMLYYCLCLGVGMLSQTVSRDGISFEGWFSVGMLLSAVGLNFFDYPILQPMWYVRCLLLFCLVGNLFSPVIKRIRWWGIAGIAIVILIVNHVATGSFAAFLGYSFRLEGFVFFSLGMAFKILSNGAEQSLQKKFPRCCVVIGCLCYIPVVSGFMIG